MPDDFDALIADFKLKMGWSELDGRLLAALETLRAERDAARAECAAWGRLCEVAPPIFLARNGYAISRKLIGEKRGRWFARKGSAIIGAEEGYDTPLAALAAIEGATESEARDA